ncbi:MAG: outer membrane beta-barrel family protein [Bacteroidales bacterium]|nr:outer membrane beta-barrel family protein [Bacteroidales bacterium]
MKYLISLLALLCCLSVSAVAQDNSGSTTQQSLSISGDVVDFLTQKAVDTMFVEIIENGRSIDTAKVRKWGWGQRQTIRFAFDVTRPGKYQIRIEAPGFKTKYVPLNIDKLHKNEKFRTLPITYMQREMLFDEVEHDEITVSATRLKFYTNGDTLVYDAAAFQMAEGSMLDALIKKLPGVELKDGGEITVNGKKVDELQLNGRELLDSDKELFLENLPAYMIKNIGVHEQTPRQYVGTPLENSVEKEMVMNVKMKREYSKGWIFNMEGGMGASMYDVDGFDPDKYLARLFASRFSDNSRLSVFVNVNNLNDYRDPGEQGSWTPLSQSTGLMETYKAGVMGSRFTTGDVLRYNGNGNVTYNESTTNTWGNSEQFLDNGNTYGKQYNLRRSYDTRLSTQHRLNYNQRTKPVFNAFKNVFANADLRASYHNYSNNSTDASATLDADIHENWDKEWLDKLLSPTAGDLLRNHAVNRTITRQHGEGHDASVDVSGSAQASPQYNDRLRFNLNAGYNFSNQETPDFNHYNLDFFNDEKRNQSLNRYNDNYQNRNVVRLGAGASYSLDEDMRHNLSLNLNYNYNNQETNRSRYLLHLLDDWDPESKELGMLPSMVELAMAKDNQNSQYSHSIDNIYTPQLGYSLRLRQEQSGFTIIQANLQMPVSNESIDYRKGSIDTVMGRTTCFYEPNVMFMKNNWQKGQSFHLSYNMNFSAPDLTQTVDIEDNSNPLNIVRGNPNLKDTRRQTLSARYRDKYMGRIQFNSSVSFTTTNNSVAMGYIYDRATGIKTSTPRNVNGNWNTNASMGVSYPIDEDQRNVLNTNVRYGFNHSVDLSSTSDVPQRSVVGTHNTELTLRYDYKASSKFQMGVNGTTNYRKSTSERKGFQPLDVYDFHYGASLQAELWGGFQVSTDLTMYSRRGYSSSEMNTNELVWNARLSKSVCKGRLTIMLDAFDLLHNLSNIRYNVNAQGRTETYNNVIPSYALLHVVWRFTKNKGDKGGSAAQRPEGGERPEGGFRGGEGGGMRPAGGGAPRGNGGGMPPMR